MGTLLPGASPLLVAALFWFAHSTSPGRLQTAGLVLLTAGLALIAVQGWQGGALYWQGDLLFLTAALLWAVYTLALADCGLDAWQSTAVISAWSAMGAIALWCVAFATGRSQLLHAGAGQIALQALFQGVLAGVAGIAGFAVAVKHLGPSATASLGAVVPALVALGGWLLLDEPLSAIGWGGVAAVAAGAWLASRRR
jgi:drug/metabolite transporter (DMT)-like permease